jgi:tape measure domain-containing protein
MAKTINIANIKIGLNIDELKTSGQFARHELSMLARTAKSAESPFQKLASAQSVLDRAFEEGGMSIESYNTMLDVLAQKFNIAGAYAELAAKRKERFDASTEGKVAAQRIADEKRLQDMISKGVTDRQKMAEAVRFLDRQYEAGETDVLGYNMALEGLEKQFGLTSIYAKNAARDEAELNKERRRAKAEADAETAAVQRLINSGLSPMAHHLKNIDLIKKQLASKSITDQEAKTAIEGSAKATGVYADRMKDISRLQGLIASSSPYSQVRSDVALLNAALDKGKINADQYAKAIMKIEQGLGHSIGGKGVASRFEKSFAGRMQTAAIGVSEQGQWNLAKRDLFGKATPEDIAAASKSKSRQSATSPQMLEKTGVAAASTAKQLAGLATAYIGVSSAMNLVKGSVKLAAEIETVGMSFQVLTKSTATSNQLMKEMRELSKSTAVPFVEHARGAKMLLGVGVASDQVKQSLYQLSAISMGNTDTFQGLVKALADVNAAGRLTGQEMLQFRNAGFNPLNEIARTTGKSMAQLKVDMEEGRIPLEMLTQAISSYTTGSGRAAGMNEKIMQTTQGVFTQFQNTMQETMIVIGQELTPAIAALIPIMQEAFSPSNAGVFLTILTKMTEGFGAIIATVEGRLFQYLDQLDKRKAEMESRRSAALTQATKQVNERGITEQRLTAQQEEWHQNEIKRIQKEREAHREKTMSILEDNAKARASNPYDPDAFERQKMREDTFGKTRAEQLQTEFDVITMSETRRINELNDIRQKQKASEDSLVIEQRLMQLRKDNPLISDDKLKDYASIEQVFQRQVAEEKQMLQARINLIKGDGGTAAQIQAAIKREEELSKNRVDGLRRTLDSALATTFKEARQELQASARALTEKWNPEQGLKQQLAQLEFMRQQNMIGSDTFQKAALDIGKQVMEARGFLPNIAPTLKAGTAEAYKYILEQNAKSEERAQMQKLTQDMLKELQQANQFNAQAPRLALTR